MKMRIRMNEDEDVCNHLESALHQPLNPCHMHSCYPGGKPGGKPLSLIHI